MKRHCSSNQQRERWNFTSDEWTYRAARQPLHTNRGLSKIKKIAFNLCSIEEFTSFHVKKAIIALYKTQQDVNTTPEDLGRQGKSKITPLWNSICSIVVTSVNLNLKLKNDKDGNEYIYSLKGKTFCHLYYYNKSGQQICRESHTAKMSMTRAASDLFSWTWIIPSS